MKKNVNLNFLRFENKSLSPSLHCFQMSIWCAICRIDSLKRCTVDKKNCTYQTHNLFSYEEVIQAALTTLSLALLQIDQYLWNIIHSIHAHVDNLKCDKLKQKLHLVRQNCGLKNRDLFIFNVFAFLSYIHNNTSTCRSKILY